MKKIVTRTLVSCAALAVVGGALIAPTLATERSQTASAAPAVTTLSATAVSDAAKPAALDEAGAKTLALETAGLTADQVSWIWAKRDYDDGRLVYDVEFFTNDYKEYDYEIDAVTGRILSVDYDAEYYAPSAGTGTNGQYISRDEAKSIALGRAGISASQAVFKKAEFDFDDGRAVYEIEFFSGNLEYEFEIDASTGNILSYERDSRWD